MPAKDQQGAASSENQQERRERWQARGAFGKPGRVQRILRRAQPANARASGHPLDLSSRVGLEVCILHLHQLRGQGWKEGKAGAGV